MLDIAQRHLEPVDYLLVKSGGPIECGPLDR
jgi:hypothetical protein